MLSNFNSKEDSGWIASLVEFIRVIVVSLMIIVPVRYFLIQPFYVKGASMEPNFYSNEYLIINEITYRFNDPKRGNIIVFKYPRDPRQYFIKRIIGLPGEKVEVKQGRVFINGVELDESGYLGFDVKTNKDNVWLLKEDEYFVMGDNRPSSMDSRDFGPVKRKYLIGKTWIRGWPFNRFTLFEDFEYAN